MPKPRKFVRVVKQPDGRFVLASRKDEGTELTGISLHAKTKRLYKVPSPGQRSYVGYLKDLDAIARSHMGVPDKDFEATAEDGKLTFSLNRDWIETNPDSTHAKAVKNIDRKKRGLPLIPFDPEKKTKEPEPDRHTIRQCLNEWKRIKKEEGCTDLYVSKIEVVTKRFIKKTGNKPISDLTADDFASWRRHITLAAKKQTPLWHNDNHKRLKTLFVDVRRAKPSWRFPEGLMDWLTAWRSLKHLPDGKNKKRMPFDAFDALLQTACEWAETKVDGLPNKTQRDKARLLQAQRKRNEGLRWVSILKLACNCALDGVDCRRIQWDNLKALDEDLPFMELARPKAAKQVGAAVERKTPLLPSTVAALLALKEVQSFDGYVFRTARGGPYKRNAFTHAYDRLAEEAGVEDWTFKHIRNVAPSVGRDGKRPKEERDAILGHVVDGASQFYTDEFDETYLIELVDLVGKTYFGGEQIISP